VHPPSRDFFLKSGWPQPLRGSLLLSRGSNQTAALEALSPPGFFYRGSYNPPELARLVVCGPSGLGQQLMVVSLGAVSDD
jgi:hypothetical protein